MMSNSLSYCPFYTPIMPRTCPFYTQIMPDNNSYLKVLETLIVSGFQALIRACFCRE